MFEYDTQLTRTAKNYNLQERDVIFAHLIATGITRADAYHVIYNRGQNLGRVSRNTEDTKAMDHINNNPGLKILIQKIKTSKPVNTNDMQKQIRQETIITGMENDDEGKDNKRVDELKTRTGLIARTSRELSLVHGKEAIQGLVSLAKLQGFDKEDTREEEEKRKFFLPWRAKCRACRLMRTYREIEEQKESEKVE